MLRQAVAMEVMIARCLNKHVTIDKVVKTDHTLSTWQVTLGEILTNNLKIKQLY